MIFSFPDTEKMEHRYAVFEGDVGRGLQMPDLPIRRRRIEFNNAMQPIAASELAVPSSLRSSAAADGKR